jgi:hypothetical protein
MSIEQNKDIYGLSVAFSFPFFTVLFPEDHRTLAEGIKTARAFLPAPKL